MKRTLLNGAFFFDLKTLILFLINGNNKMQNSNIQSQVKFLLDTLEAKFTDLTNYSALSITPAKVAGILTAKRANTTFYANVNFDSPDIIPGTTNFVEINGPGSKLPQSVYEFLYSIRVFDEVTNSRSCSMVNSTTIAIAGTNIASSLNNLITDADKVAIAIYDSGANLLGIRDVTSAFTFTTSNNVSVAALSTFANASTARIVTYYSQEQTFNFCDTLPKVNINVFSDCLKAQITVLDETVWPAGYSVSNHQITLQYPRNKAGAPVAATVQTNQYSLVVGPNIYSGGYTISITALIGYTQDDGLVVEGTIEGFAYPNVQCDTTWCCLKDCINALHEKYLESLRVGGTQYTGTLFQQLFNIQIYKTRYDLAVQCLDTVSASNILAALKEFMNNSGADCDCGCGSGNSDQEPQVITPLYSA
jgi:hypothetical protein